MLYQVTQDRILSEAFTLAMLRELGERYLGMTPDAVTKLANAKLAKAGKDMSVLPYAKLRTAILTKMANGFSSEHPSWPDDGIVELDFACLDPKEESKAEQGAADAGPAFGANTRKRGTSTSGASKAPAHKGAVPRTGAYDVAKKAGNAEADEGKWAIWQHVWTCTSFEEFFAKAPAKSVTKTGRVITASSEIGWALKSGWIKVREAAAAE